jgi:hypothetical protein
MSLDLNGYDFMTISNRKHPTAKISIESPEYEPFPKLFVSSGALHFIDPTPSQTS